MYLVFDPITSFSILTCWHCVDGSVLFFFFFSVVWGCLNFWTTSNLSQAKRQMYDPGKTGRQIFPACKIYAFSNADAYSAVTCSDASPGSWHAPTYQIPWRPATGKALPILKQPTPQPSKSLHSLTKKPSPIPPRPRGKKHKKLQREQERVRETKRGRVVVVY